MPDLGNQNLSAIKVLVMTRRWPSKQHPHSGTWTYDQVLALERLGVHCDVLADVSGGGIRPYLRLRKALFSRLAQNRYDVVHAHYGFTGIVAASQHAVPVIVTFHGTDVLGRRYAGLYRRAFGMVERTLSRRLARRIDRAIVVADVMQEVLHAPRAMTVPMGIDLRRFGQSSRIEARRRLGLSQDAQIAIFVGDPELRVKRFKLAREAVGLARADCSLLELLPVYHRSHDDVALFMNAADVLILTSFSEGSPTVIKEAMASNLPVVSVNVGDVEDQLAEVVPSRVCEPDPRALARALVEVFNSKTRSNGSEMVGRFTNEIAASKVLAIYHEVLQVGSTNTL